MEDRVIVQAGGVVVSEQAGSLRVLLVRARRDPSHWIFPKGHVEPGESAEAAAVREVREEAGVVATPVALLGTVEYRDDAGRTVRVQYFLLRDPRGGGSGEPRERRWCALAEARTLLTFESSRDLLRQAQDRIRAPARSRPGGTTPQG